MLALRESDAPELHALFSQKIARTVPTESAEARDGANAATPASTSGMASFWNILMFKTHLAIHMPASTAEPQTRVSYPVRGCEKELSAVGPKATSTCSRKGNP